jgi:hypothetical protein
VSIERAHRNDVRFTPESGHFQCNNPRLLWANSGHEGGKYRRSLCLYTNTRLRMPLEEMAKGHKQFLRVSDAACAKRLVNIVNDHCADGLAAMGLFQEIVS